MSDNNMNEDGLKTARISPDCLDGGVMYQLFLRAFTPAGTLEAARPLLPHVAETGADIVCLCPIAYADRDTDKSRWSDRQRASGMNNPKNPYRIADYYKIDPEYGTTKDLERFIDTAHRLGLRVILDLVYFHCGPAAVFLAAHPEYVMHGEDGKPTDGQWHFPRLDFNCPQLREYLWQNMEYFVRECGVDGYRCDVGDGVPLDFWEEGRKRLEALLPDVIMLNEGSKPEALTGAFDLNYDFSWNETLNKVLRGEATADRLCDVWENTRARLPKGGRVIRALETHDTVNDAGYERPEAVCGPRAVEAAMVVNFCLDGVAFLYNGEEAGDANRHSIFANHETAGDCVIDWSRAMTETGKKRFEFIKKLADMRHSTDALCVGQTFLIATDRPDEVFAFSRGENGEDTDEDETYGQETFMPGDSEDKDNNEDNEENEADEDECCGEDEDEEDYDVAVIVNLSKKPLTCHIDAVSEPVRVLAESGARCEFDGGCWTVDMLPWGFYVCEY